MLQVNNVSFGYNSELVLRELNFSATQGENLAVIGESGSGKSTLLKLMYGEYDLHEGFISWKGNKVLGPAYNLVVGYDFIKYVAQEFDLMPFISVAENIGKFLSNFHPEKKQKRINELLEVVELAPYAKTKVQFLSGGQKQRVALARALAKQPEIILLDEPFSHIDNFKKQSLRRNLFRYLKDNSITCITATHDKEDVLGYADHMLVLHKGKQLGYDTPEALYKNPQTPLIASFFGEFSLIEPYGIIFAHQIKVVKHSDLKATVKTSYFKGNYYLVEAIFENQNIFFESNIQLNQNQEVFLQVSPKFQLH